MNETVMITNTQAKFKQDPLPLPPGNLFTRLLTARVIANLHRCSVMDVARAMWPNDRSLATMLVLRATSAPATTTTSGWAAELVTKVMFDAVTALAPATCAINIMGDGLVATWGHYGAIAVPSFTASASNAGFVAEGSPIPVRQFVDAAVQINPYKVASISVMSRELVEGSNAEVLITDALVRSAGMAIDAAFFDNVASSAARPAGIRNGVSTLTPSANADPFGAAFEDIFNLIGAVGSVGGKGPFYVVGSAGRAAGMAGRFVTSAIVIPAASSAVGNDLVAVAPQAIASAFSVDPEVDVVNAGSLVMDTAPGSMDSTGASHRSVYQTDSVAIKVRWPVSWMVRASGGVAWTTPAWK